jgi:hypothetical protein
MTKNQIDPMQVKKDAIDEHRFERIEDKLHTIEKYLEMNSFWEISPLQPYYYSYYYDHKSIE